MRRLKGMNDEKLGDMRVAVENGHAQTVINEIIDEHTNMNEYGLLNGE